MIGSLLYLTATRPDLRSQERGMWPSSAFWELRSGTRNGDGRELRPQIIRNIDPILLGHRGGSKTSQTRFVDIPQVNASGTNGHHRQATALLSLDLSS
jgi:hypothetical protein